MQQTNTTHCYRNAAESNPLSNTTTLLPFITQVLRYKGTREYSLLLAGIVHRSNCKISASRKKLQIFRGFLSKQTSRQKTFTADDASVRKCPKLTYTTCFLYKREKRGNPNGSFSTCMVKDCCMVRLSLQPEGTLPLQRLLVQSL